MLLRPFAAFFLGIIGAALCPAQNADLGLLFSFRRSSYEFNIPPNRITATSNGVSVGFVPAFQVRERGPHRLYIELPYLDAGGVSASIVAGLVSTRQSLSTLSAGPRYQYAFSDRWSVYGAVDLGVGWSQHASVFRTSTFQASSHTEANPALGYGGGVDYRISKLLSVRAELRHFVLFGTVPGGRHGLSPSFGMAVHF